MLNVRLIGILFSSLIRKVQKVSLPFELLKRLLIVLVELHHCFAVLHFFQFELLAEALDLIDDVLLLEDQQVLHLFNLELNGLLLLFLLFEFGVLLLNLLNQIILLFQILFMLQLYTPLLTLSLAL